MLFEQQTVKIRELHTTICKLTKAFEEKQGAVALAETRLTVRSTRPNQELVRDPVQLRLIREIEDNTEQMVKINKNIIDANIVLRSLQRNQLELEDAINVKMITISIDETQVIPLRKTIRIQDF
ncbi:unnamed protein product [Orchesella dallaii]|uniref:Tektin n=1 Tax=Orchesella dallaii TaxID=48710 RepID=A0ABP1QUD6_9HEXA